MRILKMSVAALVVTLVTMIAAPAMAAEVKIGVMNVQKIIVECKAGKEAKERFEKKMQALQAEFKDEEDALKKLQDEIKKKSTAWSEEKKAEKMREYQRNGRELQAKTEDARFELKRMQDKELEPILKSLEAGVEKYGREKGYTAILDSKSGVVYFDEKTDISPAIVKLLDEAMAAQ